MSPRVASVVVCASLCALGVVATGVELPDPDIWWNVAGGVQLLDHGAWPPDVFFGDHGCPDASPQHLELTGAVLASAWKSLSGVGLVVLRALIATALIAGCFLLLKRNASTLASTGLILNLLAVVAPRLSLRGELFAFILLPLALLAWTRLLAAASPRRATVLVVIIAAWGWVHPSYAVVLGVAVGAAALALVGRAMRPVKIATLYGVGLALLGTALTPRGLAVLADPGTEATVGKAMGFAEWVSPFALAQVQGPSVAQGCLLVLLSVTIAHAVNGARLAWRVDRRIDGDTVVVGALTVVGAVAALSAVRSGAVGAVLMILALSLSRRPLTLPRPLLGAVLAWGLWASASEAKQSVEVARRVEHLDIDNLTPTRLTPLHAARALDASGASGLVYAPLHASNWLLLQLPERVRVAWSGRRTYALECGVELLRGRGGGQPYAIVEQRLHPDLVLVDFAHDGDLTHTLDAGPYQLVWADLRFALFAHERVVLKEVLRPRTLAALMVLENRPAPAELLQRRFCQAFSGTQWSGDYLELCGGAP